MEQKALKKMSRKELLQLLLLQSEEIDKLKKDLDSKNKLIDSKLIMLKEAGSIAEASLKINKVFESAQEAANQYLENIKALEHDYEECIKKVKSKKRVKKKVAKKVLRMFSKVFEGKMGEDAVFKIFKRKKWIFRFFANIYSRRFILFSKIFEKW